LWNLRDIAMVINLSNSDSHIWNIEQAVTDISLAMLSSHEPLRITTNKEGPCAKSLGLYKLLDSLCERFNFPKKFITIETCNLIESHEVYNIEIIPFMLYLDSARNYDATIITKDKQFDDDFKHFGHFIGHGNKHRLHLASHLFANYRDQTLQTYHYTPGDIYHRAFIGLEDMLHSGLATAEAEQLLSACPITIDSIDSYPILNPETLNITKVYPNFFVELVSLTYFTGNTFYIDEKIWRPMLMKTPFMVQGPQDFIKNLQRLGFRTFDSWWDESYVYAPAEQHVQGIINNVQKLSKLTVEQIRDMYNSMLPTLEHNYQRMLELTIPEFKRVFNI